MRPCLCAQAVYDLSCFYTCLWCCRTCPGDSNKSNDVHTKLLAVEQNIAPPLCSAWSSRCCLGIAQETIQNMQVLYVVLPVLLFLCVFVVQISCVGFLVRVLLCFCYCVRCVFNALHLCMRCFVCFFWLWCLWHVFGVFCSVWLFCAVLRLCSFCKRILKSSTLESKTVRPWITTWQFRQTRGLF